MKLLSIAILAFLFIVIIETVNAYLLLAANLDDIKSIAREFVPEQLVEQLAQAVLDLKHGGTIKERVLDEFEDVRYDDPSFSFESLREPRTRTLNAEAAKRYIISKGKKINFEQLVKKVKKRLEEEFRKRFKIEYVVANVTKKTEPAVASTHSSFRMKKIRQSKINTMAKEKSLDTEINASFDSTTTMPLYKIKTATREKNKHMYYKKDNVFEDLNHKNKHGVSIKTPKRNHLFKETYLKNSYEGNTTPISEEKTYSLLDENNRFKIKYSEIDEVENENESNKNKRLTVKQSSKGDHNEQNKISKNNRFKIKKSQKHYVEEEYETNENKSKIKKDKENVGKKVKVNKNNRVKIKQLVKDDVQEGIKETRATTQNSKHKYYPKKHKATQVTTEDVYDDEFTIQTIASSEIMAETKILGYDLKNTGSISRKPTIKLTRHRYKVPTPEFVTATTAIAEKYNFDEPIPEEDRVRENIKFYGDPTSNVNKKMKFYDLEK